MKQLLVICAMLVGSASASSTITSYTFGCPNGGCGNPSPLGWPPGGHPTEFSTSASGRSASGLLFNISFDAPITYFGISPACDPTECDYQWVAYFGGGTSTEDVFAPSGKRLYHVTGPVMYGISGGFAYVHLGQGVWSSYAEWNMDFSFPGSVFNSGMAKYSGSFNGPNEGEFTFDVANTSAPEPTSLGLLASGVLGAFFNLRRRISCDTISTPSKEEAA